MKILFAGGGTAGHINPALAIAGGMCKRSSDTKVHFVGTKEGLEVSLIPHSGYTLDLIKVHGFTRKLSLKNLKNISELPAAVMASKKIIKKFKPDIVVGTGGYVCGPVLYAAAKMGIPTLVHESNAFPGITTKILARYVDVVAVGMEAAKKYLPETKKVMVAGSPIRPSMLNVDAFSARRELGLDSRPFIVIFGGSLGARDFNSAAAEWIMSVADSKKYQILMATGKNNQLDKVNQKFEENNFKIPAEIKVDEYIYNMDIAMNAADLIISRAGASTLAELTAIGKPAILVPSPYVTDNHQQHNAEAIESGGGAVMIKEADLSAEIIEKTVSDIVGSPERLAQMKKASFKMGVPHSIDIICDEIERLV